MLYNVLDTVYYNAIAIMSLIPYTTMLYNVLDTVYYNVQNVYG